MTRPLCRYTGLDRFGRVVEQNYYDTSTSSSVADYLYGYDQDSNVLFMKNAIDTAASELYSYDSLNRLTSRARHPEFGDTGITGTPSETESWTLDALGNFASLTLNGTTTDNTTNQQNEETAIGSASLGFDSNGNTTTDQNGHTLIYDAWNRLVEVKNGSTVLETISYDALGHQDLVNSGTATDLYYSSDWQVLEEDISGSATTQYVWGAFYVNQLIERDNGSGLGTRLYAMQDTNWNVVGLVDATGTVQERYIYDPYGGLTILTPIWGSRGSSSYSWIYLFQGGRLDTVAALYAFQNPGNTRQSSEGGCRMIRSDLVVATISMNHMQIVRKSTATQMVRGRARLSLYRGRYCRLLIPCQIKGKCPGRPIGRPGC